MLGLHHSKANDFWNGDFVICISECVPAIIYENITSERSPTILCGPYLSSAYLNPFLLRDAWSAQRGIAILSRPSVCPSVRDVDVPWSYASTKLYE